MWKRLRPSWRNASLTSGSFADLRACLIFSGVDIGHQGAAGRPEVIGGPGQEQGDAHQGVAKRLVPHGGLQGVAEKTCDSGSAGQSDDVDEEEQIITPCLDTNYVENDVDDKKAKEIKFALSQTAILKINPDGSLEMI